MLFKGKIPAEVSQLCPSDVCWISGASLSQDGRPALMQLGCTDSSVSLGNCKSIYEQHKFLLGRRTERLGSLGESLVTKHILRGLLVEAGRRQEVGGDWGDWTDTSLVKYGRWVKEAAVCRLIHQCPTDSAPFRNLVTWWQNTLQGASTPS